MRTLITTTLLISTLTLAGCGDDETLVGTWSGTLTGCNNSLSEDSAFRLEVADSGDVQVFWSSPVGDDCTSLAYQGLNIDGDEFDFNIDGTCGADTVTYDVELDVSSDDGVRNATGSVDIMDADGELAGCETQLIQI